jgi:hypothetical protein
MGFGRFVCVAVPFGLTLASIVCILIAMLAGVTDKNLDMFEIKTQNLSISSSSLQNLANEITKRSPEPHYSDLTTSALNSGSSAVDSAISGDNITAAELGLADLYKVSLWGYCSQTAGSKSNCTKAKFDWASSALNTTAIETLTSTTGVTVNFPKEIKGALKTYAVVSKWTEVVYIIAIITAAVELIFGLFGFCSRAGSCCTFILSGISTTAIIAASIMATAQSSIVTGAVLSVSKAYGVKASLNTGFLAVTWLAVAFSIGAGLFWMFSICCCANDHHSNKRSNRRSKGDDSEKLIPTGAYQRVEDPHHFNNGAYAGQQNGAYNGQEYGVPMTNVKPTRGNGAYEPYSHTAI